MKIILLTFCFVFTVSILHAQTAEDSVKAIVNNMFAAMKNSDTKALLECFADSSLLQTIARDKQGKVMVRSEAIEDFAKQVGSMPKNAGDERIIFETIKIDGPMANVWTPYQFYYNGKFSHCGVNNFVLVKIDDRWKIQYIIDTRRKAGCNQ